VGNGGIEMEKNYLGDFTSSMSVGCFNKNNTKCNDKAIMGRGLCFRIHYMNFLFER
jgi:hypothetical protein